MTLKLRSFLYSLGKKPPVDMGELMGRAQKYVNPKEMMDTRRNWIELKRKGNIEVGESSRAGKRQENNKLHASSKAMGHTRITARYRGVCSTKKNEIEALIKRGHLSRFVKKGDRRGEAYEQKKPNGDDKEEQIVGEIVVIFGGLTSGGDSRGARKRYTKKVLLKEKREPNGKRQKQEDTITFNSEDEEGTQQPHDGALVVSLLVVNYKVRRMLINNRSSINIIFWSVLQGMKISKELLKSISTPLVGFGGDIVHPVGMLALSVTIGTTPQQITSLKDFLVVDRPSVYNIILGHPSLNAAPAITSIYHLKIKFPTLHGTGMINRDKAVV
ncbi:uncharacterized protein LOC131166602 [Malania oleifera]|uniref:uncharacterized protein LOC131166602 n=1 Tax=Malania oleifera TaxID=397392 RepID=UPI0025AE30DB|nr:uncharacterized protein LOC131166602 [Malania oleifera]